MKETAQENEMFFEKIDKDTGDMYIFNFDPQELQRE